MLHRPLFAGIDHFDFGEFFVLVALKFRKVQNGRVAGGGIAHAPQLFYNGLDVDPSVTGLPAMGAVIGRGRNSWWVALLTRDPG